MPKKAPALIDSRLIKALSHPTRIHILDILSEGPSSPRRMAERTGISLNLIAHHVKVLRDISCIELIDKVPVRGATEHIYRARERQFFDAEEWEMVEPIARQPITATLLRLISEDAGRSLAEGKFDERADNHLSRSPVELDDEGWREVVATLARALDEVLEAHGRSAERSAQSGEELMVARIVMMQFLLNRPEAA